MDAQGHLWLALITTLASLCAVVSAVISYRQASECISLASKLRSAMQSITDCESRTESAAAQLRKHAMRLAKLENDPVAARTRDERRGPPPLGASKAELRRYYGLNGASHQEVARRAMLPEVQRDEDEE